MKRYTSVVEGPGKKRLKKKKKGNERRWKRFEKFARIIGLNYRGEVERSSKRKVDEKKKNVKII